MRTIKSPIRQVRNQLIDRRGFMQRMLAAGTALIIPQVPLIPAFGQVGAGVYKTRPPWKVAGVDYCVGVGSNVVLKDPQTIGDTIRGVQISPGQLNINLDDLDATTGNVVIDGYHFVNTECLDQGANCNSVTFRNCLFEWTPDHDGEFTSVGIRLVYGKVKHLIVEHCEFGNMLSSEGTIDWAAGENLTAPAYDGSLTVRWCFFNHCKGDGVSQKSGGDLNYYYNVLINQCDAGTSGHLDQLTLEQGPGRHFKNTAISFNTIFDDEFYDCGMGSQGFTLQGNDHCEARIITEGGTVDHNTWVNLTTGCPGDGLAGVFYGPCVDVSDTSAGKQWVITDNYVDDVGFVRGGNTNMEWLRVQNTFVTSLGGSAFSARNIDLRTNTAPPRNNRGFQDATNIFNPVPEPDSC